MAILGLLTARSAGGVELPRVLSAGARSPSALEAAIEAQAVCVGSTVHSFGELGEALLYHATQRADGRVEVGYYVFYSEERPWGNNWLTWTLVPAPAVDLVYTRMLLLAPGAQRLLYGKGDVEGFRLRCYEQSSIRPLTDEIAREFHLEKRAGPASEHGFEGSDGPGAPEGEVVNTEEHHRAEDGHEESSRRLVRGIEPERSAEEAAHEGAGDAEERREDEPARLSARREQLGNRPDDQAEHDPEYD